MIVATQKKTPSDKCGGLFVMCALLSRFVWVRCKILRNGLAQALCSCLFDVINCIAVQLGAFCALRMAFEILSQQSYMREAQRHATHRISTRTPLKHCNSIKYITRLPTTPSRLAQRAHWRIVKFDVARARASKSNQRYTEKHSLVVVSSVRAVGRD